MTPERWGQVNEVFHSALKRGPAERAAFLDQACDGDQELRKEVESLIGSHEDPDSFIDAPALEAGARLIADDVSRLTTGQRLGHYRIISPLGKGGMGQVYLAQDSRLGRKVALKLLHASLTQVKERVRRFEQEARAVSALNHPNILTIHEVDQVDGIHFIATEYIEGNTLRQRATERGLRLGEAMDVAIEVAGALAAAHQAGVIHRDIKPENIMLRSDGYVKVLDFGLAKLTERDATALDTGSSQIPALKTETGAVMGTAHYMSPEQARGVAVDERTDVFSLGVVIYEMVTAHAPFEGETPSHVIVSILEKEPPPLSDYFPKPPADLQRIISKALSKNREQRYQAVKDLLFDLKSLRQQQDLDASIEAVARTGRPAAHTTSNAKYLITIIKRHRTAVALALVAFVVAVPAVVYLAPWTRKPSPIGTQQSPPSLQRLTFDPGIQFNPAFSPDGRFIAFTSRRSGNADIWVQAIGSGDPIQITRSPADDVFPAWSPDGTTIVFRSEREGGGLFVVPAFGSVGSVERKISPFGYAPSWSPDGTKILFSASDPSQPASKLYVATPEGSTPHEVLLPDFDSPDLGGFRGATWHPDGKRISFQGKHRTLGQGFWTVPLTGGTPLKAEVAPDVKKQLNEAHINLFGAHWAPSGKALYFQGWSKGTINLWKVVVDPQSLRWIGGPERLTTGAAGEWDMRLSRDGKRLAFVVSTETTRVWSLPFNARTGQIKGEGQPLTTAGIIPQNPTMSPDGKKLLFVATHLGTEKKELIEKSLDNGRETVLANSDSNFWCCPRWSRDSKHIAYCRRFAVDSKDFGVRIVSVPEGGGDAQEVNSSNDSSADDIATDWSADGHTILAHSNRGGAQNHFLGLFPLSAAPHAERGMRVVASHPEYNLYAGCFSPDDRWIAFNAVKGNLSTIFVVPLAGGAWTRITEEKGWNDKPNWSRDGRILYFVSDRITGYLNVWGIHFDPISGRPVGEAFQITSYKSESRMLWQERALMDISIGEHRLMLPISEVEGSIWMLENVDR